MLKVRNVMGKMFQLAVSEVHWLIKMMMVQQLELEVRPGVTAAAPITAGSTSTPWVRLLELMPTPRLSLQLVS